MDNIYARVTVVISKKTNLPYDETKFQNCLKSITEQQYINIEDIAVLELSHEQTEITTREETFLPVKLQYVRCFQEDYVQGLKK